MTRKIGRPVARASILEWTSQSAPRRREAFDPAKASPGAPLWKRLSLSGSVGSLRNRRSLVKIGAGYGRRAALATLASVGLVVLIGHLHMRNLAISTAAQAAPARPPGTSDGQDQVKQGAGFAVPPAAAFATSPTAGFAASAANGIRNLGHVCNWETQDWDDLSNAERQAFQILGWSRATWDGDNEGAASSSRKDWSELTPKERKAAQSLGYSARDWDVVCPRDIPE
jgi:hypothetical protein